MFFKLKYIDLYWFTYRVHLYVLQSAHNINKDNWISIESGFNVQWIVGVRCNPTMFDLETIPEEAELPRISQLIPKSPETIKREIETKKLCDKYLNDQNLKLYYAMLVTNKNFRQLCTNNGPNDMPSMNNNCNQMKLCQKAAAAGACDAKKTTKSTNKCNVSTSISEEDINYFYNGKIDVKKCSTAKPFHPSNTNTVKWNNCNHLNLNDGEQRLDINEINSFNADNSGRKMSATTTTAAAAVAKKRSVSTSIPTEDIRMLCANLIHFNSGSVKNVREWASGRYWNCGGGVCMKGFISERGEGTMPRPSDFQLKKR